jgi:GMP synthase (glutamine-hydrolysing)
MFDRERSTRMILVLDTEVRPDYRYLGPEIAHHTPGETEYREFVEDPTLPDLDAHDGIIVSGSTASVYDRDEHREWLEPELELVRQCVADEVPLLGVCFGHQAVNVALGGEVVGDTRRATFVEMEQTREDEVLDGVAAVVPVLHADLVTELGDGMVATARTDYNEQFCSRHADAAVWTVQFHPEFTGRVVDEPSDWDPGDREFAATNATRVFENFRRQVDRLA